MERAAGLVDFPRRVGNSDIQKAATGLQLTGDTQRSCATGPAGRGRHRPGRHRRDAVSDGTHCSAYLTTHTHTQRDTHRHTDPAAVTERRLRPRGGAAVVRRRAGGGRGVSPGQRTAARGWSCYRSPLGPPSGPGRHFSLRSPPAAGPEHLGSVQLRSKHRQRVAW